MQLTYTLDGTIRKSPKILNKWSLKNGAKNKSIQKQLLKVGLSLLKPVDKNKNGGFLLYSTCSLNPMENQEVISEVLDELNNNSPGYGYELVNLSDDSSLDISGNFLSVLPARSHGGFFVAAIRKLMKGDGALVSRVVKKREDSTSGNYIVEREVGTEESKATISYCITSSTCYKEITEMMGRSTIISCGVPVLYESKCTKQHILVQGFTSSQERFRFQHIRLSHLEFMDCYQKCSNYREIMLHMNLDEGRLVIVEIVGASSSPEEGDCQSIRLPARVVQVNNENDNGTVVVAIEARPQVFSRTLSLIDS